MTRQANQSKAWDFYLGREVSEVSDASLPFYRKGNWSYEFKHTQRSRSSAGSKHRAPGFHLVDFSISQDLSRKDNRISFKCHAQLHLVFINKTYVVCWFCDEGTHARCGGHLAGMESSWFSLRGHALQPVKYVLPSCCSGIFLQSRELPPLAHFMSYGFPRKLIRMPVLAMCFSKEAELRSW